MATSLLCLQDLAAAAASAEGLSCVHLVKSECSYYHYLCDGVDDRGWGCGYRTLQSLCSWAARYRLVADLKAMPPTSQPEVPSIHEIQSSLVAMGDKPHPFVGSKEWIGCFEASIVIDHLYKVPCKVLHVPNGSKVAAHLNVLTQHFSDVGSPVMIGGDIDGASKTLIGITLEQNNPSTAKFLIADPHYTGGCDSAAVLSEGHVRWHSLELFQEQSFYNFCLPQS